MTRRATVLPDDVEWVVGTLTANLNAEPKRLQRPLDWEPPGVVIESEDRVARPASYMRSRRQLIEDIQEYLTERMRHG